MKTGMELLMEQSPDARAWSEAFMREVTNKNDAEWAYTWFANAMMSMHDHIYNKELPMGDAVLKFKPRESLT
jgi:hypothetical protein